MAFAGFIDDVRAASREEPVRLIYRDHASPGRLRFRLTWLRDFPDEAPPLADALSAVEGVVQARVRPFTGSVLVLYDPDFTDEDSVTCALLAATGCDHCCLRGGESKDDLDRLLRDAEVRGSAISRALVATVEQLHIDFLRLTGGRISLASASALGMLAAGISKLVSTEDLELPPWHQLIWYAYQTFKDVQERYASGHKVHTGAGV
jgi:hypothetical protein